MHTRVPLSVHVCICDITREQCCSSDNKYSVAGGEQSNVLSCTPVTTCNSSGYVFSGNLSNCTINIMK